jgi:hypothetical protein
MAIQGLGLRWRWFYTGRLSNRRGRVGGWGHVRPFSRATPSLCLCLRLDQYCSAPRPYSSVSLNLFWARVIWLLLLTANFQRSLRLRFTCGLWQWSYYNSPVCTLPFHCKRVLSFVFARINPSIHLGRCGAIRFAFRDKCAPGFGGFSSVDRWCKSCFGIFCILSPTSCFRF